MIKEEGFIKPKFKVLSWIPGWGVIFCNKFFTVFGKKIEINKCLLALLLLNFFYYEFNMVILLFLFNSGLFQDRKFIRRTV